MRLTSPIPDFVQPEQIINIIECKRCGRCCKELPIDIGHSDITRWNRERRTDILKEVSFLNNFPSKGYGGFYIEKTLLKSDREKKPCPFYIKSECSIYSTRPMVCKDYSCEGDRKEFETSQGLELRKVLDHFDMMMVILKRARI